MSRETSPAASGPVLVLLGPTATGKTAIAVEVALRIDGEIVSADSRAFFEGLDVVTAKPTVSECRGVPHHLIGAVPLDRSYDAMTFRQDVDRLIPEIASRGRTSILAGGGTLYLGAVLRGIFEGPSKDEALRSALEDVPIEDLHERLRRVDPVAAASIHRNDRLRIVRALEVHQATGRPISDWQTEARPLPYDFVVFGLQREREDHRAAIEDRVGEMLAAGLVDEVRDVIERGLAPEAQAYRTIGVPEVVAHVEGRTTQEEMVKAIVRQTWALARRQRAWFRRDRGVIWVDVTGRSAEDLAGEIVTTWKERIG